MPLASSNEPANARLRRMEEEFDSREDLSEDDSPPTDASEDSVEVRVTPITRPQKTSYSITRIPHKFRKALTQSHLAVRSPSPTRLPVPSPSSTNSNYPDEPLALSPQTVGDKTSPTTNQAFPQAPLSPGASARARANRRKPAEPRKLCADQDTRLKRPLEEEDESGSPKPIKIPRVCEKGEEGFDLSQPHSFMGHGALIAPLIPPGGFPHLLIPPWSPVVRHPYARLVGNVMAPPFGLLPGALPPHPYPLIPIVPTPPTGSHPQHLPQHISSPPPIQSSDVAKHSHQDKPVPLVSKEVKASSHSNRERLKDARSHLVDPDNPHSSTSRGDPEGQPQLRPVKAPSKFLSVESLLASDPPAATPGSEMVKREAEIPPEETIQSLLQQPKQKQRNYKNMTRERRIEANARERTRVHTISAAFEKLRKAIPSYSHNQKLSKLSVLRIAGSYILSLSRLAGRDYSLGETAPSFEECVDLTTRTIQVEGKAKKKRDDS